MNRTQLPNASNTYRLSRNKFFIRGLITGSLLSLMLIPTWFISSLLTEKQRQRSGNDCAPGLIIAIFIN